MIHINKRTTNYQRIKLQVLVLLQKKNSEVLLLKKKKKYDQIYVPFFVENEITSKNKCFSFGWF